jgi:hypothetical protein
MSSLGQSKHLKKVRFWRKVVGRGIARMAWAMMVRGEQFKEPRLLPAA